MSKCSGSRPVAREPSGAVIRSLPKLRRKGLPKLVILRCDVYTAVKMWTSLFFGLYKTFINKRCYTPENDVLL